MNNMNKLNYEKIKKMELLSLLMKYEETKDYDLKIERQKSEKSNDHVIIMVNNNNIQNNINNYKKEILYCDMV